MKRLAFLLLLFCGVTITTNAQKVITVEHGSVTTFYTSLDSALSKSQNGDKVYLPGGTISSNQVPRITISKAITLIGVGYNADSNAATGNTVLSKSIQILPSASGGMITGIYAKDYEIGIQDSVTNFTLSRCYVGSISMGTGLATPPSNISIIECAIKDYIASNCSATIYPLNILIQNSVIGTLSNSFPPLIANSMNNYTWNGINCRNSILVYASIGCGSAMFKNIQSSTFENCVIIDLTASCLGGNGNTYRNCLFNTLNSYVTGSPSNNSLNCIYNQNKDSIFINNLGLSFDIRSNYHLKSNCPGRNAGIDGKDVGIYGLHLYMGGERQAAILPCK